MYFILKFWYFLWHATVSLIFFLARNCCVDVNMMRNCCAEIYMASNCCIGINFYKTFYLIPIPIKLRFFTYLHYPIDTQKSCQKFYEIISHAKLTLHYIHYFQGTHQTNRKEVEILNTMTFIKIKMKISIKL